MKVIKFPQEEELTADTVLNKAAGVFKHVLILGWNKDGQLVSLNTKQTYESLNWQLDQFKLQLLTEE